MLTNLHFPASFQPPKAPTNQKFAVLSKAFKPYEPALALIVTSSITYLLLQLLPKGSKQAGSQTPPCNQKKDNKEKSPPPSPTSKDADNESSVHTPTSQNSKHTENGNPLITPPPHEMQDFFQILYPHSPPVNSSQNNSPPFVSTPTHPLWNHLNTLNPFTDYRPLSDICSLRDLYANAPDSPSNLDLCNEIFKYIQNLEKQMNQVLEITPKTPCPQKMDKDKFTHLRLDSSPRPALDTILKEYPSINTLTLLLTPSLSSLCDRIPETITRLVLYQKDPIDLPVELPTSLDRLHHLEELYLNAFVLDSSFLRIIKSFTNLKSLSLDRCKWENPSILLAFLDILPCLSQIEKLSINWSWDLPFSNMKGSILDHQYFLKPESYHQYADKLKSYLNNSKTLHSLCLNGCPFFDHIGSLPKSLVLLSLEKCLLSAACKNSIKALENLLHLYVGKNFLSSTIPEEKTNTFLTPSSKSKAHTLPPNLQLLCLLDENFSPGCVQSIQRMDPKCGFNYYGGLCEAHLHFLKTPKNHRTNLFPNS